MSASVKTGFAMAVLSVLLLPSLVRADDVQAGGTPAAAERVAVSQADDDASSRVGSATTALLAMQREGQHSTNRLPMLGDEATAAYTRYLDSFTHKIPAFFSSSVTSGGENAGQGNSY